VLSVGQIVLTKMCKYHVLYNTIIQNSMNFQYIFLKHLIVYYFLLFL